LHRRSSGCMQHGTKQRQHCTGSRGSPGDGGSPRDQTCSRGVGTAPQPHQAARVPLPPMHAMGTYPQCNRSHQPVGGCINPPLNVSGVGPQGPGHTQAPPLSPRKIQPRAAITLQAREGPLLWFGASAPTWEGLRALMYRKRGPNIYKPGRQGVMAHEGPRQQRAAGAWEQGPPGRGCGRSVGRAGLAPRAAGVGPVAQPAGARPAALMLLQRTSHRQARAVGRGPWQPRLRGVPRHRSLQPGWSAAGDRPHKHLTSWHTSAEVRGRSAA
jgi:hypothetical protein